MIQSRRWLELMILLLSLFPSFAWLSFAKSPADLRINKIRRGFVTLSHG